MLSIQCWIPLFILIASFVQYTVQYDDGHYRKAVVASDVPRCSDMGMFILEQGGSAVDAAITSLLCIGVVDPQSSSIGGGISMVVYMNKTAEALISLEKIPLAADPYMLKEHDIVGAKTIAVPRQLIGIWEAHQRFGKLEWKQLFDPVIAMARNGYPVSHHMSHVLHYYMDTSPEVADFYRDKNGLLPEEGDIMKSLKYADTLEKIANNGVWEFYMGGVGKSLLKDIQDQGSIITKEDLCPCNIKPSWEPVASTTLKDGVEMITSPLPGNGELLTYLLNIMDGYDISEKTFTNDTSKLLFYNRFLEAVKLTQAYRTYLGDDPQSDFVNFVRTALKSKTFASESRQRIHNQAIPYPEHFNFKEFGHKRPSETAHLSILAANGDAVSVTTSVGFYFGSRVYSESTGIFFNNHLTNFFYPGFEDHANGIKPGRTVFSSTAPAILLDNVGDVKMVVGSSGGDLILATNAWVILRVLRTGATLQEAVDERRIYANNNTTMTEPGGSDPDGAVEKVRNSLIKLGHEIYLDMDRFAVIQAIVKDDKGDVIGYCDKRKGGAPAGY